MGDEAKLGDVVGGFRAARAGRSLDRMFLLRPVIDAAVAFTVLFLLCVSIGAAPLSASPQMPPATSLQFTVTPLTLTALDRGKVVPVVQIAADGDAAIYHRTSMQAAWGLLLISLSIVAAFNMALVRHMMRAYAVPRRTSPTKS